MGLGPRLNRLLTENSGQAILGFIDMARVWSGPSPVNRPLTGSDLGLGLDRPEPGFLNLVQLKHPESSLYHVALRRRPKSMFNYLDIESKLLVFEAILFYG